MRISLHNNLNKGVTMKTKIKKLLGIKTTVERKHKEAFITIVFNYPLTQNDNIHDIADSFRKIGYSTGNEEVSWCSSGYINVYENDKTKLDGIIKHLVSVITSPKVIKSIGYGARIGLTVKIAQIRKGYIIIEAQ